MQQINYTLYHESEYQLDKRKIKGILFDMDGVILDTEKLYTRFWQEAAQFFGYPMTREQALGMRSLNREAGKAQLEAYFGKGVDYGEIRNKRIELMNAFVEKEGVTEKPGIRELVTYLIDQGYKTAVATSSPPERTRLYLESVGLADKFDILVSGYMVERGKPEPDIYLYAAEKLGLKPSECLVLEDSPTGILAAHRAGCVPVMIPDQDEPTEEVKKILAVVAPEPRGVQDLLKDIRRGSEEHWEK